MMSLLHHCHVDYSSKNKYAIPAVSQYHDNILMLLTCTIDHTPTDAGDACKTSSQRTRTRATRECTPVIYSS